MGTDKASEYVYKGLHSQSPQLSYSSSFTFDSSTPSSINSPYSTFTVPSPAKLSNNYSIQAEELIQLEKSSRSSLHNRAKNDMSHLNYPAFQLSKSEHQMSSSQYNPSLLKPESRKLRHQPTSSSLRSCVSNSTFYSANSGPSSTSQSINFVRKSHLNKDLPPLPPHGMSNGQAQNSNLTNSLPILSRQPLRQSSSLNQLTHSDFQSSSRQPSPSLKQLSTCFSVPAIDDNLTFPLAKPGKFIPQSNHNYTSVPVQQVKRFLSHNELSSKIQQPEPPVKSTSTTPANDQYAVFDSDVSSSDDDFEIFQRNTIAIRKQKLSKKNEEGYSPTRKNSAPLIQTAVSDQLSPVEFSNPDDDLTFPQAKTVCIFLLIIMRFRTLSK